MQQARDWSAGDRTRRAGVSAFGISGTNAHVIIEEAPAAERAPASEQPEGLPVLAPRLPAWVLSGRSAAALVGQAGRLREHLVDRPQVTAVDVAWSLATTRSVFSHRAVVLGEDRLSGLASVASVRPAPGVTVGEIPPGGVGRTVFVFPGQGSQWVGMGRELAEASPVFAARLAECGAALAPYVDWDLDDVLAGRHGLEAADVVQPALWAVMVSLAAVWQAAGVRPDAVVGHSQGEIAAAAVAGILSLDDAAKIVALRSKALSALAGRGGMLSIAEPVGAVRERIAGFGDRLSIAAVNGPSATVVSGEPSALRELQAACGGAVRTRLIPVDYASHGPQVEELRAEILEVLAGVAPRLAVIPMVSALTGRWLTGVEMDAGYWFASLREPVEFDRAVQVLSQAGHGVFVEVSPHPVLIPVIEDQITVGTLRRDEGGAQRLLSSLAEAYVSGLPVDWPALLEPGKTVALPTYAFQRRHFWPEARPTTAPEVPAGEAAFWAAVEGGDPDELAATLNVDGGRLGDMLPMLADYRRRSQADASVADWRYRVTWAPVADSEAVLTGRWLVVGDDTEGIGSVLARRGAEVVRLADAAELTSAGTTDVAGVVSLLALAEEPADLLATVAVLR
ncbi:acyltransferase domain-containing protein, partial [Paractinoplanes abujensis]|uniref:acyltransferase domain-containing protein n=1 Tax=Paractinoplanes abujensis TaxID=882441 RepID=UPI001EF262B7